MKRSIIITMTLLASIFTNHPIIASPIDQYLNHQEDFINDNSSIKNDGLSNILEDNTFIFFIESYHPKNTIENNYGITLYDLDEILDIFSIKYDKHLDGSYSIYPINEEPFFKLEGSFIEKEGNIIPLSEQVIKENEKYFVPLDLFTNHIGLEADNDNFAGKMIFTKKNKFFSKSCNINQGCCIYIINTTKEKS